VKKYILLLIIILSALLRFYHLGGTPPSLYWDETSLGYNAYSILKTGHDEHGNFLPFTNFPAFGDYKPPLYIYAAVPAIAVLGLNEFAIRFPSAFFGVLTVLVAYFIAKKIFEDENTALFASLFLAISPWHIQLSRGAFEGNLALFFSSLGILFFIKFAIDRPIFIFLSALSFLAAIYTFTGQRLFVPFILLVLVTQFRRQVLANLKYVFIATALSLFIFWPLFRFATQTIEGRLRFEEVTIFKDLEPIDRSTRYREKDGFSILSSLIHNRRLIFAQEYLKHYFDAFNPSFLFTKGDVNPRFSTQEVGQLYYADLFLILFGIYFLFAKSHKYRLLIIGWLLVSPLGPATARETPHALRMVHILPVFQLIAAYGLVSFYKNFRFKKIFLTVVFLALFSNLLFYLHIYYVHWPKIYSDQWQYGYKQAVLASLEMYDQTDYFVISKDLGRPYIYFLFYTKYDPAKYRQTAQIEKDKFFFIDVNAFDKFRFVKNPEEADIKGRLIYIMPEGNTPPHAQIVKEITRLDGQVVFEISKSDRTE
jgi:4-amino-4-deoxy-L-arabinose transferase-like glycosyltransferase